MQHTQVVPYLHPIDELPHDLGVTGESYGGDESERQLDTHHCVQVVVQTGEVGERAEERRAEGWDHGDASSEQHSLPHRPLEVEEALHGELASVGARHGGALTRG